MVNWTDWQGQIFEKAVQPYEGILGIGFWALIFTTIIGYVYLKQQSYTAAAVAALVLFAVFVNYFAGIGVWVNLIYVLVALAISMLFLVLFSRRRN